MTEIKVKVHCFVCFFDRGQSTYSMSICTDSIQKTSKTIYFCSAYCHDHWYTHVQRLQCTVCHCYVCGETELADPLCAALADPLCAACMVKQKCVKGVPITNFGLTRVRGSLTHRVPAWFLNEQHYYLVPGVHNVARMGIALIGKQVSVVTRITTSCEYELYARANWRCAQRAALLCMAAAKYAQILTRDTMGVIARLIWKDRYDEAWLQLDLNP